MSRAMSGRGPNEKLLVVLSGSHEWCYFLPVLAIVLPAFGVQSLYLDSLTAWVTFNLQFLQ